MSTIDYFYDGQIRRFLLQVVRAFSGFQYETGKRADGTTQLKVVPCRMAAQNKQVGAILRGNSENMLMATPMITVFIKDMAIERDRTQAPGHVSTVHVNELAIDPTTGEYINASGARYSVERMMPHPLQLTIQVDVWTSNELQKHQLFEQIFMAFNVGFDIQSSDNPLDWTALSTMTLENVSWSSRSIPIGTTDDIDVMSFTFKLPVWISPPAKVKQQRIIEQIVTNINHGPVDMTNSNDTLVASGGDMFARSIVTPGMYQISIDGDEVTLIGDGLATPSWKELLAQYGTLIPAQSLLRLRADIEQEDQFDIIGSIQLHNSRPDVLLWQIDIDTVPSGTIPPVNALIDPLQHFPGAQLPAPSLGQRYLILQDIGPSPAWGDLTARQHDIIEFGINGWNVVFTAAAETKTQYVINQRSGKLLRFYNGGWIVAIDGVYHPGFWRVQL